MPKSKTSRFSKLKVEANIRSTVKSKQSRTQKVEAKLKKLQSEAIMTDTLRLALNASRLDYAGEQRKIAMKYMLVEIALLEDIKLQLQR